MAKKGKKGRFVAFRLHPNNPQEAEAIRVFDDLLKQEFSPRQIGTDALLRLGNRKPEDYTTQLTKGFLEDLLKEFAGHILGEIREIRLIAPQNVDSDIPLTEDDDEEYARNLAAGFLSRRRQ